MIDFNPARYRYTAQFCEENIWWLTHSLTAEDFNIELMSVLFFSNSAKKILMLEQKSAPQGHITMWDYHVVLKLKNDNEDWIFDFDSRLPFPVKFDEYRRRSFMPASDFPGQLDIWVRAIPARTYLRHFYSDRSHMKGLIPAHRFPNYPIIQPAEGDDRIELPKFWNMDKPLEGCELKLLNHA